MHATQGELTEAQLVCLIFPSSFNYWACEKPRKLIFVVCNRSPLRRVVSEFDCKCRNYTKDKVILYKL